MAWEFVLNPRNRRDQSLVNGRPGPGRGTWVASRVCFAPDFNQQLSFEVEKVSETTNH